MQWVGILGTATLATLTVACGGHVANGNRDGLGAPGIETNPSARATGSGGTATGGGGAASGSLDAGHETLTSPPVSSPTAPAVTAYDCLSGDVGESAPDTFVELDYSVDVCAEQGSSVCLDLLYIHADCSLWMQSRNVEHDATASPPDCAALARWATSRVLATGLDNLAACVPDGGPMATTEIQLTGGLGPRKKMALCAEEPYASHRACIAAVRAKYFPGL